jgi:glutamyl/glutaminyl-tRNA synthetase
MIDGRYLLKRPTEYEEKIIKKKWKDNTPVIVEGMIQGFNDVEFEAEILHKRFTSFLEENSYGMGAAMPILRVLITGRGSGPGMFEIMSFIGKEESLRRLQIGLEKHANV